MQIPHSLRSGLLAVAVLHATLAGAQQQTGATFGLGHIEVIDVAGTRTPGWSTPFQATLQAADLRRFERNDVASALSLLPGVSVQNLGARSEKLVYIRGFNSRQVPLFIDGVPVYVPYDGNFDLSRLLTFDVAEINVSKGYSSVLYGANTLGGSINVVSRRPQQGVKASLRSDFWFDDDKDDNSRNHHLALETAQGNWYVQSALSFSEQDYFRLPDGFRPTASENGGKRENSGTRDLKLALKAGYTPNATDEYAVSYQRQEGEKNTPPYAGTANVSARFWRWPQYDKESLYFISRTALGDTEYVRTRVYYDTFENLLRSFDNASYTTQNRPFAFNSVYDDYAWGARGELGSTRLANHTLKAGLQYKRDVHRENDVGKPVERMEDALLSLGIEDAWQLSPALAWSFGAGWDRQQGRVADDLQGTVMSVFPVAAATGWNAQTALKFAIDDTWTAHASVARRTRFPTMKDRYSYRLGTALPNPGLDPEYAVNLEVGLSGNLALAGGTALELSTALFQSRIDDTIESVTIAPTRCTSAPCSQLQNIGRQDNSGVELGATLRLNAAFDAHVNYTWLDRDNKSSPLLLPLDTPQHKAFGYLRYAPLTNLDLVLSVQDESGRFSATNGTRRTGSFTTVDFKAVWEASERVQLELGGRNLGDELYAFEEGFPEAGRSWFFNVQLDY